MAGRVSILPGVGPVDIDRASFHYDPSRFAMEPVMVVHSDGVRHEVRGELATHIRDGLSAAGRPCWEYC